MATTLTVNDWALTELTLDMANQSIPDVFIANAADASGRGIDLYITKDGTALSLTGMSVYLAWSHENGNQDLTKFTAVSAATGHYRVLYPNAMMYGGRVLARISICVGTTTPITGSRDFNILVERNPIDEDKAMSSENMAEFKKAVQTLNTLESTIEAAEKKRVTAENTRVSNENQRIANENTRKSNETARVQAEKDRATAAADALEKFNTDTTEALNQFDTDSTAAISEAVTAAADAENAASKANAAAADVYELVAGHITDETQAQIDAIGTALAESTDDFYLIGTTIYAPSSKATIDGTTVKLPSSTYSGTTITLS